MARTSVAPKADSQRGHGALRSAIELDSVSFAFGATQVLREVSLDVKAGEMVAVVGRSGSGKTTLLRIMAGLVRAHGTVKAKGITRMVFQEDRLFPWYTAYKNIAVALRAGNLDGRHLPQVGDRVHELLAEMGILHLEQRFPHELSGGEKQRVAIARAFAGEPDVVLMDEPFGSLDVLTRETMQTWLLDFWQRRHDAAIVLVTHDVEEGLLLADRIAVLSNGSLNEALPVEFERPRHQELRYTPEFLAARKEVHARLLA